MALRVVVEEVPLSVDSQPFPDSTAEGYQLLVKSSIGFAGRCEEVPLSVDSQTFPDREHS